MGHIKISQTRIHFIKNVEKYIETCITRYHSHAIGKPNLSPITKLPISRHDEFCLSSSLGDIAFFLILFLEESL